MRRIMLISFIDLSEQVRLQWLEQFTHREQDRIVQQVNSVEQEIKSILAANYPALHETILIGQALVREIGI